MKRFTRHFYLKIRGFSFYLFNTEYTFETHAIPETGYELISIIPKGALIQKLIRTVGSQYFLTLVIFIAVCSFLIYFISRFFNTISELTGIMNKITSGNRRALKNVSTWMNSHMSAWKPPPLEMPLIRCWMR